MDATYRTPLGNTSWSVWRDALLRTTGFPAAELDRLAAPACAEVADAYLAGRADLCSFRAVFDDAVATGSAELARVAADPLLREAVAWQNPGAVTLLDAIVRQHPARQRGAKARYREGQLTRFWQRYCAKAETIGFFGPITWVEIDPDASALTMVPGRRLLDRRRVFFEPRALVAYGAYLSEDPAIRRWLPPARHAHHLLDGEVLRRPGMAAVQLNPTEAAVLARCDGRRPAARIIEDLLAAEWPGIADIDDGFRIIANLVDRKLLRWDANLPLAPHVSSVLADRIAAIADPPARQRAEEGLRRLCAARDAVGEAAGDPDALRAAMVRLDAEFVALTGRATRHREGQTYAGRGLCYEDTTRDLHVVVSKRILDMVAPALAMVLQGARWFTAELARVYDEALRGLVRELGGADGCVKLSDLWYPAVELCWGRRHRPMDEVMKRLADAWRGVFGLTSADPSVRRLEFTSDELAAAVRDAFPAEAPGWIDARVHSPDLHICATSVDAINRGDFFVVLGELHISNATLSDSVTNWPRPDPGEMLRRVLDEFGRPRVVPLLPTTWSKDTGRLVGWEPASSDWFIGFARTDFVESDRLVPAEAIVVELTDDGLIGLLPNGQRLPAIELFTGFLSTMATDAFKITMADDPHTPRVTVDRLVVLRETWRMTVEDLVEITVRGDEPGQYLAGRRVVARYGLPARCFVRLSSEVKPMYVDFTSPQYVASFAAAIRAARLRHGGDTKVSVSEMLPTPDLAWVADWEGHRYLSELRVQMTDPAYASTVSRWPLLGGDAVVREALA